MATTTQISFRLSYKLLSTIDFLATQELRTRSNMIEYMLTSWIREHGNGELEEDEDFVETIEKSRPKKGTGK